jgi:amylosucrase
VESALEAGDTADLDLALARLRMAHAIVYGFGGLPLLYMGDELALLNDDGYLREPEHAEDNRWMHRPRMPWDRAGLRSVPATLEGRMHATVRTLARVRSQLPALHAAVESRPTLTSDRSVLAVVRRHAAGDLVQIYNAAAQERWVDDSVLATLRDSELVDRLTGRTPQRAGGRIAVPAYGALWLTRPD